MGVLGYRIVKVLSNSSRYAVVVETNGNSTTALISSAQGEINKLFSLLVESIENPPDHRIEYQFQNFEIKGDQIIQNNTGSGSQYGKFFDNGR